VSDETIGDEARLLLKHALEIQGEWKARVKELAGPDPLPAFLRDVAARARYYREQLRSHGDEPSDLRAFPLTSRADHEMSPGEFLAGGSGPLDGRLAAFTNGTLGAQLRVQFDAAGWYEFNYGPYAAVAQQVKGLAERLSPGETGVFFITNARYQPQAPVHVYVPTLDCALLQQLVIGRSDDENQRTVERLRSASVTLLYGKASTLLKLAALDAGAARKGRIRPFAILVSGEALYDDQRLLLSDWFGCSVLNAYISTEGGLIALSCAHRSGLHVRPGFVRVEVLSVAGEVSDTGAGEIVITNLFNRAHVFVRYLLRDHVEIVRDICACGFAGQTIISLRARETELFSISSEAVPAAVFGDFLRALPLEEFQVSQVGASMPVVKWIPKRRTTESIRQIAAEIHRWLRERGWDASIASVPLDEITPRGGKQRRFVRTEP